jgi:hypothetical protein
LFGYKLAWPSEILGKSINPRSIEEMTRIRKAGRDHSILTKILDGLNKKAIEKIMQMNSRKEALLLYKEVLKTCKVFYWSNEKGIPW